MCGKILVSTKDRATAAERIRVVAAMTGGSSREIELVVGVEVGKEDLLLRECCEQNPGVCVCV